LAILMVFGDGGVGVEKPGVLETLGFWVWGWVGGWG
jgi:hypothetical protein